MKTKNQKQKYILKYDELKVGDIILKSEKDPFSLKIQKYTNSNFSHVMICVENASMIHSDIEGVFSINPQRILVENSNDLKVLRLKSTLSDTDNQKIQIFLREKIGSIYSIKDALLTMKQQASSVADNEFQFCSRLVAQAYKKIDYMLVKNIDFCSPSDIENSEYLYEVKNIIRETSTLDITYASTRNLVEENQTSMFAWLNKSRDLAWKKYKFQINIVNDVDKFLFEYHVEDENICDYIEKSGYMENYKIEVENNPHMHDEKLFISKFVDSENIIYALIKELNTLISPTNRHMQNYQNSMQQHKVTKLKYYNLHIILYQSLLSVSMSKLITIFEVSRKLILENIKNDKLHLIMLNLQRYIEILRNLNIERYNKS